MSKKYDYSKVTRAALEALAKYNCECVGGLDNCAITNRVRDEAQVTPRRVYDKQIADLLRKSLDDANTTGEITTCAVEVRRLVRLSKYAPEES
jgi:hypothetical protein